MGCESNSNLKGHLIIISGPSGTGKGTIIDALINKDPSIVLSVSCTTRKPRPTEVDGVNYYFLNRDEFLKGVSAGNFLEYANVFGNLYGTPKDKVIEKLSEGKNVLLEIDVQGASQVKKNFPDAITIFIMPPSEEELLKRLKNRATETPEQLENRIKKAADEMAQKNNYDYIVVNEDLDEAVNSVYKIISKC